MGAPLEKGVLVAERFSLRRRIGAGGMGTVWEAVDTAADSSDALVALKFLKGNREEDRRRFLREVRAAAAVEHPNVVRVHDVIELADGGLVMVMDRLHGETLGAILRRVGRLPLATTAAVLRQVALALEAAHRCGVVHRDLKPENVFLERRPAGIEVKVLDFGVAKLTATEGLAAESQALTGTGSLIGTPYYMSPEQVLSERDVDGRADVWSLGIVFCECLTGKRPTEDDNVGRVFKRIILGDLARLDEELPDAPDSVRALVDQMLVVDRKNRLVDLGEVGKVLATHASPVIEIAPSSEEHLVGDAYAETVLAERARGGAAPPLSEESPTERTTTHAALAMSSPRSSGVRRGVVASAILVAAVSTVAAVRLRSSPAGSAPLTTTPVQPTSPAAVAPGEPIPSTAATTPAPSAAAESPPPVVSGPTARASRPPPLLPASPRLSTRPSAAAAPSGGAGVAPPSASGELPPPPPSAKPRVNFAQTPKD